MQTRIFLLLAFLPLAFLPIALMAQINSGMITYDVTTKLDFSDSEMDLDPAMLARMPKSTSLPFNLYFTAEESLYKGVKPEETSDTFTEEGGVNIQVRTMGQDNARYTNLAKGEYTEKNNFLGREFLIQDKVPAYEWELMDEQKTILGLPVKKAMLQQDTSQTITAWYCTAIPVAAGPDGFSGLPGLILELDVDNGDRVYTATKFNPQAEVKEHIVVPSKGKKVNQEEMDEIRRKKLEELTGGSGGPVIKIIRQ